MDDIELNATDLFIKNWKYEVNKNLIGNLIILSIYLVVGVVGNIVVLCVYKYHLHQSTDERYFIPYLAMSDMCATITGAISNGIWDFINENFTNVTLCKSLLFILSVTAYASILILECIAIQRYLLICRTRNLSGKYRRIMLVCSCIGAVCLAAPFSVVYDINELYSEGILVGYRCGRSKERFGTFGTVYAILFGSLMCMTVIVLVVLYGKVGCIIFRQFSSKKFRQKYEAPSTTATSDNTIEETRDADEDKSNGTHANQNWNLEKRQSDQTENGGVKFINIAFAHSSEDIGTNGCSLATEDEYATSSDQNANPCANKCPPRHTLSVVPPNLTASDHIQSRNRKLRNKFSLMFIIITTVSLLCYMPVGVIVVLEGVHPTFWDELTRDQFIIVTWLYHTYIINSIANPIIYAFLDREFRNALKIMFKCS